MSLADVDDPIVGVEHVLEDENGPGALPARSLASPPSMTPAAFLRHCLTHVPYHPGCPICAATRKPNTQHRPPMNTPEQFRCWWETMGSSGQPSISKRQCRMFWSYESSRTNSPLLLVSLSRDWTKQWHLASRDSFKMPGWSTLPIDPIGKGNHLFIRRGNSHFRPKRYAHLD